MRILENDLNSSPQRSKLSPSEFCDVLTIEEDPASCRFDQPNTSPAHCRLSASALTDETQYLSGADTKRYPIDRVDHRLVSLQEPLDERHFNRECTSRLSILRISSTSSC